MPHDPRRLPDLPGSTGYFSIGAVLLLAMSLLLQIGVRPPWQSQFPELATGQIVVGDQPLTVELAISIEERARGLGFRDGLAEGTGMLFVDEAPNLQGFWMKGMRFCLDIVWIEGGQVVGAAENACPDPEGTEDAARARFRSPAPVTYVLEVPAGWMAERGYGAGTPVTGIEEAIAPYVGA